LNVMKSPSIEHPLPAWMVCHMGPVEASVELPERRLFSNSTRDEVAAVPIIKAKKATHWEIAMMKIEHHFFYLSSKIP